MRLVAITGSIGCGKSTLADLLRKLGYLVYNVDGWTGNLYRNENFCKLILNDFPEVNDNGKVNKKFLRKIVFDDAEKLKKLEKIVHPLLKQKLRKVIAENSKFDELIFIDAALIYELGWDKYCDLVIVADVDYEIQKQRVMSRDNISAEDFEKIVALQMNNNDKICRGDVVINTDKSLGRLKIELFKMFKDL